ncbi:hypothetical protein BGW36DRAFT_355730 [Talaromyces proteolyticus]|uniref:Uncharacterized protein n=1 Tax=Talaromyces proteolyticus TaxID=1131652 RepID=A0AAD4Q3B6_9EURO|nr:uncharacterized protein BGW36DRAFT_355730 [Talaromyces proteolyticus]KAH8701573.1 hypothetical protein BGW36DRAFT_355730 [Talaromyces proteolyticus]
MFYLPIRLVTSLQSSLSTCSGSTQQLDWLDKRLIRLYNQYPMQSLRHKGTVAATLLEKTLASHTMSETKFGDSHFHPDSRTTRTIAGSPLNKNCKPDSYNLDRIYRIPCHMHRLHKYTSILVKIPFEALYFMVFFFLFQLNFFHCGLEEKQKDIRNEAKGGRRNTERENLANIV